MRSVASMAGSARGHTLQYWSAIPVKIVNLPVAQSSWLDPSALSQIIGAFIGAIIGAAIAIVLWQKEGNRLRQQSKQDRNERQQRVLKMIALDLFRMSKGVDQLLINTDELQINSGRGLIALLMNRGFKVERNRFISLLEAWLDTDTLWMHIDPAYTSQPIIDAVGSIISMRDGIFTEFQSLAMTLSQGSGLVEQLSELQTQLRTLDAEMQRAKDLVNETLMANAGGAE